MGLIIHTFKDNAAKKTSVQFSSVAQSCPTLWDPMNHSTLGIPVHHQLMEFTQTHVHRVRDAIQPSHTRSSPSPPAPNPSSLRVFSNESTLRMRRPKYWSFSFSISPSAEHPGLISLSHKNKILKKNKKLKKKNTAICSNMDGPREYYTYQSQSDRKTNILCCLLYVECEK